MAKIEISVPGSFDGGCSFLDIETVKVATGGYQMRNGENLANRWRIKMAGIARDGKISIVVDEGSEAETLAGVGTVIAGSTEVRYGATREFDEMIAKGRFTNARRAHEPRAFAPAVPGVEDLAWRNIGTAKSEAFRSPDIASRDIPKAFQNGTRQTEILVHLLRDVADLILVAGSPDETCRRWCENVLVSYGYALAEINEAS